MDLNLTTTTPDITQDHGGSLEKVLMVLTAIGTGSTLIFLFTRLCAKYVIPEAWKLALLFQDIANLLLGAGLVLFLAYMGTKNSALCRASGFFFLVGLLDTPSTLTLTVIGILFLQNPGKLSQLSTFKKSWLVVFLVPEKLVVFLLALMPVTPIAYFDTTSPYPVACFPVRQEGGKGAAFGAILFFILWVLILVGVILSAVCAFKLWQGNNSRVHASSPNLWQAEKIDQSRKLLKMLALEQVTSVVVSFITTVVVYTNKDLSPQWVVLVALSVSVLTHAGVSGVQVVLWCSLCSCCGTRGVKEPYQKLKKLELIKVEGPGKIRLRASWSAGRGETRRGLVKVYGLNQLKRWAQEIVVLGMLRKCQHASLLQCLWTSNTNPYFETMTLLSGQIITSDARLICLELTNSGCLHDFLQTLDVPLPETCTRTILHDLAEGLALLHDQNILHRNLTSSAVYLKGSVQRLVLRASLGDFEEAQIYGSLQNGGMTTTVNKKHFFLPDIRAFALVALEILGHVCQRRLEEKQPHRRITCSHTKSSDIQAKERGKEYQHERRRIDSQGTALQTQFVAPGEPDDYRPNATGLNVDNKVSVVTQFADSHTVVGAYFDPGAATVYDDGVCESRRLKDDTTPLAKESVDTRHLTEAGTKDIRPCENYAGSNDNSNEPGMPPITQVREARNYEFPNNSVFKGSACQENDYDDVNAIEEKIERGALYHALAKRREKQSGGYIVTRSGSGRELFIPVHQYGSSDQLNSDSGYVGTSSASSMRPYHPESGSVMDEPPDLHVSKMAHRTTSANTVSSFGDDILEVLPGMADDVDMKKGSQRLQDMLRAREEAKVEQILQHYEERVQNGTFFQSTKEWPMLKFSRNIGNKTVADVNKSRPTTPQNQQIMLQQQLTSTTSPRPKSAAASLLKRIDKVRPLSASHPVGSGVSNFRNSLRRNKARNELSRVLSKGTSYLNQGKSGREQRGAGGQAIESKYARHNASLQQIDGLKNDIKESRDSICPGPYSDRHLPEIDEPAIKNTHLATLVEGPSEQGLQQLQHPETSYPEHHTQPTRLSHPNIGAFSSFSSSDSFSSYFKKEQKVADTSLASGELTSLSSQADTNKHDHVQTAHAEKNSSPRTGLDDKVTVIPGVKLVDSGFDEDTASEVSNDIGEACTCSCPSTGGMSITDSCSCTCSQCHGSQQVSGWSESQSNSSWSNSNSFSSYDVKMHRRKLSSKSSEIIQRHAEHVLGPDEQYPEHVSSKAQAQSLVNVMSPRRLTMHTCHNHSNHSHHSHRHHHHHSHSNHSSTCSKGSSTASRRYRELTKKGVPLRVSVVDERNLANSDTLHGSVFSGQHRSSAAGIAEEVEGNPDTKLYQDLESQGFFDSTDSASSKSSPTHLHFIHRKQATYPESKRLQDGTNHIIYNRFQDFLPAPSLEEIIQEIPDETSGSCSGDETRAFLNRPESQLSLKVLRPASVTNDNGFMNETNISDLYHEPKVVHRAELVIDKIFSRAHPTNTKGLEHFVDPMLGLDESAIRELAMLPYSADSNSVTNDDGKTDIGVPLLHGMDTQHVRYIQSMTAKVTLLTAKELLPADARSFDNLRRRLQHTGNFGKIGLQLLDIIGACWVQDAPPCTSDIVEQLTDHITETEL